MSAANNEIMVRYSDDAHTWSNWQFKPIGDPYPQAGRPRKVVLSQQGYAEDRVYHVRYTEDTDFSLLEMWADISVGDSP